MGSYVPTTAAEREEMLAAIGVKSLEDLYQAVPQGMLLNGTLNIPEGMSELEVREAVTAMAEKNKVYKTVLRGAGAYRHFIPAVVKSITSREELVTCYTPYQAEISQGVLQGTFEFQTMICELTGMDVANASHYDGATAAAETIPMCRDRKRTKAYVSACVNPQVIEVMQTYCFASNTELTVVPAKDGRTDLDALKAALGEDAACFYLQQPNYFGQIEDARAIGELIHAAGAKFVMGVNPIACALLPTPCEMGADIAVGDGQPLGLDTAFGGPYLGFMATTAAMTRKLPGRIVGQTKDVDGKTGYVLTLSAREQHIRREKASSNICSNQALCAFTAGVITTGTVLFPAGIQISDAADAARALEPIAGQWSTVLFASGLVAASFLAACVLPGVTSSAICEAFGWERGADRSWDEAPVYRGIITAIIGISAVLVLMPGVDLFQIMMTSQVINGVLLPVVLVFQVVIAADRHIMGANRNGRVWNVLTWATIGVITVLTVVMFVLQAMGYSA